MGTNAGLRRLQRMNFSRSILVALAGGGAEKRADEVFAHRRASGVTENSFWGGSLLWANASRNVGDAETAIDGKAEYSVEATAATRRSADKSATGVSCPNNSSTRSECASHDGLVPPPPPLSAPSSSPPRSPFGTTSWACVVSAAATSRLLNPGTRIECVKPSTPPPPPKAAAAGKPEGSVRPRLAEVLPAERDEASSAWKELELELEEEDEDGGEEE
mmetsp:Transcript_76347/g.149597  ORF Transcript_76347/g.149597 Transcript_76347/m.149597 type:complete len:218 (-) Transcript_76347:504-1157(-)